MPITQPTGQEHQMPTEPNSLESAMDRTMRSRRSENVAIMKGFIRPAPRSTPSETSLAATAK